MTIALFCVPVNKGASLSFATTVILTVTVVVLPSESVTEYVASYTPTAPILTFPLYLILLVKSPSSLSVAVMPSVGLNVEPFSISLSTAPLMTGALLVLPQANRPTNKSTNKIDKNILLAFIIF